jgi:CubicO group peptidase (beta-lactamase class C family)
MGSMNKMFTAVAIMQLVQNGKISLDAPLGTYVTDYPNRDVATKVTIEELLTHTGGTGDFNGPEFGKPLTRRRHRARDRRKLLRLRAEERVRTGRHVSNGIRCFGHNGGAPGMSGSLLVCPGPGYTIAALANVDPPAAGDVTDFVVDNMPLR